MSKNQVFEQRLKALQEMEDNAATRQHLKGKLTARERINVLFDEGTFFEFDAFVSPLQIPMSSKQSNFGDGVVVGRGLVQGRSVFAYAQDFTVLGGSLIHISEPTRLGMISYAVFCLKKKKKI